MELEADWIRVCEVRVLSVSTREHVVKTQALTAESGRRPELLLDRPGYRSGTSCGKHFAFNSLHVENWSQALVILDTYFEILLSLTFRPSNDH